MRGLVLAILVSLGGFAKAQTGAAVDQQVAKSDATLHARAQLVVVDVVVTDRSGAVVHGLPESEFSVFEDKAPQTVKSFEEHNGSEGSGVAAATPGVFSNAPVLPGNAPVDVLLLDSLNTPPESQPYLRDQLVSYVDHAKPGTRLAIFVLNTRLRMLQGLTSDPLLLKAALIRQGVRFSPLLQRDLNDSAVHEESKMMTDIITSAPMENKLNEDVQTMLLDTNARETSEKTVVRIQLTLGALDEIARYLAGVPGRKNLIWFSGAFPTTILRDAQTTGNVFAGNANMQDEVDRTLALLTRSRVAISPVDARGLEVAPGAGADQRGGEPGTQQLTYGTNAVNPRDTQFLHDVAGEHITMQGMADATGGMALFNTNGLTNAMEKVSAAGHSYYTLTYTPPSGGKPGGLREIAVKLKQGGLHLAYRREYISEATVYEPWNPGGAAAPPGRSSEVVRTAMAPYTADATEVLFDVTPSRVTEAGAAATTPVKWVGEGAFAGVPHAQYIVMLNLDPRTVAFAQAADGKVHGVLDFIVIVYDANGKQVDAKLDRAAIAVDPDRYKKMVTDGMRFRFNLLLPLKGDELVRFGVHDATTDRIGTLGLSAGEIRNTASAQVPASSMQAP